MVPEIILPFFRISSRLGGSYTFLPAVKQHNTATEQAKHLLEEQDADAAKQEQTVRGYKVKVRYKPVNETEKKARKKVIAETILQALNAKLSATMVTLRWTAGESRMFCW
jgi:hypothetical protein